MAIVEDEVRNDSDEDNDIEVVIEEDDADQDTEDDSDDDDDGIEMNVEELTKRLTLDTHNYDEQMSLIAMLWNVSLEQGRKGFENVKQTFIIKPDHWLLRIQKELQNAAIDSENYIGELFQEAALDCYYIPIFSEWCSWSLGLSDSEDIRDQLNEVLKRAGADPFSGKLFWDTKVEIEKAQLDCLSDQDPLYKEQSKKVLYCLEEIVSRPLLRGEQSWQEFEELALKMHNQEYVDKVRKQHEVATEFLEMITPYEDRLLTAENPLDKMQVYTEYIEAVKQLSYEDKFEDCDTDGILKVLYERVSTECPTSPLHDMLVSYSDICKKSSSLSRVLKTCARRCPTRSTFWVKIMRLAEQQEEDFEQIKSVLETALSKVVDSYKECEEVWMAYLEYLRRKTTFSDEQSLERLRMNFRLAWDSLAEAWSDEANDCEIPLFWARLEYKQMNDPKQGKEIFEEIFKYGENKTLSKYWEPFIQYECSKTPPLSENKVRDLFRRSLKFVKDYPPGVARHWTDYERDYGTLQSLIECREMCESKIKEWRSNYQAMKDKMSNPKKGKQPQKAKEKKMVPNKGKRKADPAEEVEVKKKKEDGSGVKRSHTEDAPDIETKRQRKDSEDSSNMSADRESCTLFVSNLEFKVNEQNLRDKLSEYGDIVSMRLKAGVKAFGGSICYCQYKKPESVTEAIRHDRTPLDGRPMFLSRYSSNKGGNKQFKYSTNTEKNKVFVKNLPFGHCTKEALTNIFEGHGTLLDVRVVTHKDGRPKGLAYIEYSDSVSAQNALEKCNGLLVGDRNIVVAISAPPKKEGQALGLPKRDAGGGMRRTQLSSFIPSVLQKPSTSKDASSSNGGGEDKPKMSNTDFRNMLLNK